MCLSQILKALGIATAGQSQSPNKEGYKPTESFEGETLEESEELGVMQDVEGGLARGSRIQPEEDDEDINIIGDIQIEQGSESSSSDPESEEEDEESDGSADDTLNPYSQQAQMLKARQEQE